jgi:hypothetical protein
MVKGIRARRRPSYSREHWQGVIEHWRASGLSKKAYCRQQEITPSVFARWYRRITSCNEERAEEQRPGTDAFMPIYVTAEPQASVAPACQLEIILAQGHRLSVQGIVDWTALGTFLAPLLRAP